MIRTTLMAMVIGAVLAAGSAGAKTAGPVCKAQCAPRIEQDCGALRGKALKRCRRTLLRACKATTPQTACLVTGRGPGTGDGGGSGGGGNQDVVQAITDLLDDKLVTTESSDFFSSGSITTTRDMQLCSSGAVNLVETQITSTFGLGGGGSFDSTTTFDGTWRVRLVSGAPVLEMNLGEAEPRQLVITQDQGELFLDGNRATVSDATGACGGTPGDGGTPDDGGGTPDLTQQLTQALAGRALILVANNIGSGTSTTVIVLCDSGRYTESFTVSAAPGRSLDSFGAWSIELTNDGPALVLADDQGGEPESLVITEDTDGSLLLNGQSVGEGDAGAVPGICAQI